MKKDDSELYREQLLVHYHNPENLGCCRMHDVDIEMDTPTWGTWCIDGPMDAEGGLRSDGMKGRAAW
jgi:hypothetical protein